MISAASARIATAVAAALLIGPGAVGAAQWQALPGSTLEFEGVAQGEEFRGRFVQFDANVRFDPSDLPAARMHVSIDMASVDSANVERDEILLDNDFFSTAQWPLATWEATRFRTDGTGYIADGELTLRGVRRPVPLHFQWTPTPQGAVLEGRAMLDRLAFEVGGGDWTDPEIVAHAVQVQTRLDLAPAQQ